MVEVLLPNNRLETATSLAKLAATQSERDFLASQRDPVVLIPRPRDSGSGSLLESSEVDGIDATPGPGFYTLHGAKSPITRMVDTFREALVAPLVKSDRNTFAQMITIGRASNNDIVVAVSTISKLHGYFMPGLNGTMRYFDAGSTNGSSVAGQPVAARTSVTLEDGVEIALGPDVRLLFRTPSGLFDTLRLIAKR